MEGSAIDIVIFAPLAPILGVILFWFIQLVFIESEKYLLEKIRPKHKPLCRFTNFLGLLFQTICHALGYTITKSGISGFYISINYGRVAPKKEKKGIFEWVSNIFLFIGPFFIPACLILLFLFFLMQSGFELSAPSHLIESKFTFAGQITTFGTSLFAFSKGLFDFLFNIDLLHPAHFGFMLLMIFLGMGMRPSYIGEKKLEKIDMIYDLRNIWRLISHKPLYLLLLFLISYVLFYISLFFDQNWYVALFSVFGWLSIISIISIIIANMLFILIKTTDEIPGYWKFIPYITIPSSYILVRLLFFYFTILNGLTNSISLIVMILSTFFITFVLLYKKTNKFKTRSDIKSSKKKDKVEKDE